MKRLAVIILAAGQGTRMRSKLAKVLHPVGGRPMILYAAELAQALAKNGKGSIAVVTGHQAVKAKDVLAGCDLKPVVQTRRRDTWHAGGQPKQGCYGGEECGMRRIILLS